MSRLGRVPPSQSSSTSSTSGTTSAQCTVDDDCAYLDVDDDPCTFAGCVGGSCDEQFVVSTPECQCHDATDCAYYEDTCNTVTCVDHLCATAPRPAGPAPSQMEGDCATLACDGATETPQPQSDLTDVGDDGNDCTADSCDASGPVHAAVADGAACGDGFCFLGECMPYVPANRAACGDEGADAGERRGVDGIDPRARRIGVRLPRWLGHRLVHVPRRRRLRHRHPAAGRATTSGPSTSACRPRRATPARPTR